MGVVDRRLRWEGRSTQLPWSRGCSVFSVVLERSREIDLRSRYLADQMQLRP
jgi:hypothetical protein